MNFGTPPLVTPGDTTYNSPVNPGLHLGQLVQTRDGRRFRFAQAGVTLAAGNVAQTQQVNAAFLGMTGSITAVGAKSITVTPGAAGANANTFAGGLAIVSSGPGIGQVFGVRSHPTIVAATPFVITLENDEAVQVALTAGSTIGLYVNPYLVIPSPIALTGSVVGVAQSQIDVNNYGFVQVSGLAGVLIDGTPAVGQAVSPSTAVVGAAAINATTGPILGSMVVVGVAGFVRGVNLQLA